MAVKLEALGCIKVHSCNRAGRNSLSGSYHLVYFRKISLLTWSWMSDLSNDQAAIQHSCQVPACIAQFTFCAGLEYWQNSRKDHDQTLQASSRRSSISIVPPKSTLPHPKLPQLTFQQQRHFKCVIRYNHSFIPDRLLEGIPDEWMPRCRGMEAGILKVNFLMCWWKVITWFFPLNERCEEPLPRCHPSVILVVGVSLRL